MKKPIAKLAATGVLALAAMAGTVATASASTPSSASMSPQWSVRYGPFPTSGICEQFVWDEGAWGIWDCESYDNGHSWYAYAP